MKKLSMTQITPVKTSIKLQLIDRLVQKNIKGGVRGCPPPSNG